ncbi:MAG: hypothetical protein KAS62_08770, partial [Candidatus Delongbacteria bacterium]|nr:hypothetical protein [Candidatus Delongbacteria bacterium]
MKKYISMLIIFSILSIVYAQDVKPVNNLDRLEKDIPFIRDRYGKNKKGAKKKGDGFKYFMRSFLVPGWGEYKLGRKKEAATF